MQPVEKEQSVGNGFIHCTPKFLPRERRVQAAIIATQYNPANRPVVSMPRDRIAVLTSKYWGSGGVKLTVAFPFDQTPTDVQNKILAYMNKWGEKANVTFVLSNVDPQVRIAREADGYWSYLGTDILLIPRNEPTMNLQGFTMRTPDREYDRVVTHEAGHTLGFPHEHMRKAIVDRLDPNKTIAWGRNVLGWDRNTVIQQILTPLSESSIMGTPNADETSIMCYQLPASITRDGRPILGGSRITDADANFVGTLYPKIITPPPPPVEGAWAVVEQSDSRIVLQKVEDTQPSEALLRPETTPTDPDLLCMDDDNPDGIPA